MEESGDRPVSAGDGKTGGNQIRGLVVPVFEQKKDRRGKRGRKAESRNQDESEAWSLF